MRKQKTSETSTLYAIGDSISRRGFDKSIKQKVIITGIVDSIEITKHKNPFLDKCYHIIWNNGTCGWWSESSLARAEAKKCYY